MQTLLRLTLLASLASLGLVGCGNSHDDSPEPEPDFGLPPADGGGRDAASPECDLGPIGLSCWSGPCCDTEHTATVNADCSVTCPEGSSMGCEIDPAAFCFDTQCAAAGDCVVTANTCCGVCGRPTLADVTGIPRDQRAAYRDSLCGDEGPVCPGCPSMPNPHLVPTCEAGVCGVADLEADPMTACTADDDCRLRTQDCCECGGDLSTLVAIRTDAEGDYAALACGEDVGCPECAPTYPADVTATCEAGRCTVTYTGG